MEKEPKLTVVVPIGDLLGKTYNLTSWLSEVNKYEIKVILVASTIYPETCHEIQEFLSSVAIHNQCKLIVGDFNNPGSSRNAGLLQVKSEWVAFWDADDVPRIQSVLNELDLEQSKDQDFIVGSFGVFDGSTRMYRTVLNGFDSPINEINLFRNPGIWRWIFRKEAISGVLFPENRMGEDQVFLARTEFWTKKMRYSQVVFYDYYTNHPGQLTSNADAVSDLMESLKVIIRIDKIKNHKLLKIICFKMVMTLLKRASNKNRFETLRILVKLINDNGLIESLGILKLMIFSRS